MLHSICVFANQNIWILVPFLILSIFLFVKKYRLISFFVFILASMTLNISRYWIFFVFIHLDIIALSGIFLTLLWKTDHCWKKRVMFSCFTVFLCIHVLPIGRLLIHNLEYRIAERTSIPDNAQGFILLGGSFNLQETTQDRRPLYNEAAGRLVEFFALAKRYPQLPIVFSGNTLEAFWVEKIIHEMGIDLARVKIDSQSRNTYDHVLRCATLIQNDPARPWILVTSAFHMPRSLNIFRSAGWNIEPYSVAYHTHSGDFGKQLSFGLLDSLNDLAWKTSIKEWAGLLNHYLDGQTRTLYPSA